MYWIRQRIIWGKIPLLLGALALLCFCGNIIHDAAEWKIDVSTPIGSTAIIIAWAALFLCFALVIKIAVGLDRSFSTLKKSEKITVCAAWMFAVISILVVGPRWLPNVMPRECGVLEAVTGRDTTGFAFSSLGGSGTCRFKNVLLALKEGNQPKLYFGHVYRTNGSHYPHLWAVEKDRVFDDVCPMSHPECWNRRVFAIVDARTLEIEWEDPIEKDDATKTRQTVQYLKGLIDTSKKIGDIR